MQITNRIITAFQLFQKAFGKYQKQILILIILGFVGGSFEGIGVGALIPLFSFAVGDTTQVESSIISELIKQFFNVAKIEFNVTYLLWFIIAMFTAKAFIKFYLEYIKIKITTDYENTTRNFLFKKILKASWPHLLKQQLGHLDTVALIDVSYSSMILREISVSIILITSLIAYVVVAINISFLITAITLILGLIIFAVITPMNYRAKILSRSAVATNKSIAHYINENILGMKTVKSSWVHQQIQQKAQVLFESLRTLKIKTTMINGFITAFIQPIGLIFICVIFAFTYKSPTFSLASLIAIIYIIQRIFTYIQTLLNSLNTINEKLPYLKSVLDYQDQAVENEEAADGDAPFIFNDSLEFRDTVFSYSGDAAQAVLKGVNFIAKKGEMIGIIGPSGVGKTTLVDLILRLLSPSSGSILLDGKPIDMINLQQWRKNIGYVSQDIFLMNDTIANNIRFYDDTMSDEKVAAVAKLANIYELVDSLPDKFNTVIGERGTRLSVGQRQRVVIARILARAPQILVLDEATSALDNESEIQIQRVIENLKGKVMVLVIAHRLSTIEGSDKLLVLENGQIKEQGKPQDLLKDKDTYFFKTYNLTR